MNADTKKIEKKIAELASKNPPSKWREQLEYDKKNRFWLKMSSNVAMAILETLDQTKVSKTELAKRMNVSLEEVNKIVKGQENLNIETISKIELALGIKLGRVLNGKEVIVPKGYNKSSPRKSSKIPRNGKGTSKSVSR
jgi:ribosome-binding protein aMBF1 (putative translation factor)